MRINYSICLQKNKYFKILDRKLITFLVFFLLGISLITTVYADWDGFPYNPGETNNPECLPSQTDCDVLPSVTTELDPNFTSWLSSTPPLYSFTETDPIFTAWDKDYADLTNTPSIPSTLASLSDDATHRLVTDTEKGIWNGKQDALGFTPVSNGTTVNGHALSSNVSVTATDVNLGNVTDESKATMFTSPTFTGTVSGITGTMVGLGNVPNLSFSGSNTGDETNSTILTKLGLSSISGSNTGDETQTTIQTKLGVSGTGADGYLTSTDWNIFNSKQPAGAYLTSFTELDPIFSSWLSSTPPLYSYTETDPTIYSWAKATTKPTYTATEVGLGNVPNLSFSGSNTGDETNSTILTKLELSSISGSNTGDETQTTIQTKLGASGTGADGYLTSTDWNIFNNKQPAGSYITLSSLSGISPITYDNTTGAIGFTNPGYITSFTELDPIFSSWLSSTPPLYSYTETDPTIYSWAKATTKPTYTYSEVGAQIAGTYSTDIHSNITALNAVSGTNTGDDAINSLYSGLVTMTYPNSGIPNSTGSAWGTSYSTTGSGTVLALATTPTFTTNITTPLIIGGTAVGDFLTYKSTTGAGTPTGIAHQWLGGTNGATVIQTMLNNGNVGINNINPANKLDVDGVISTDLGFNMTTVAAPTAPTLTLVADNNAAHLGVGVYVYRITYITAIGETSSGAIITITTDANNRTVQLSNIPISTNPKVTGRRIYRTMVGMTSDRGYLLATINNITATTYTDIIPDASLTGDSWAQYRSNTTSNFISLNNTRSMIIDPQTIVLGYGAATHITSAGMSTIIGSEAGRNLTYAFSNTFIGWKAAPNTTTGGSNVAIGAQTLVFNTTGGNNISIGDGAMRNNLTGSNNVGIGGNALGGISGNSISFNVGLGASAGAVLKTGTWNTFLGGYSGTGFNGTLGWSVPQIGDVTHSTAIGDNSFTSASYQTAIGSPKMQEVIMNGDTYIKRENSLGNEILTNGVLTGGTSWATTNDATLASDKATWTYSAGTVSTLTQTNANLAVPTKGGRWYKFTYTLSGMAGYPSAFITIATANVSTPLYLTGNGTHSIYFFSATTPTNFVITSTLIAGQAFTLDTFSLKEVIGGDLNVNNNLFVGNNVGIGTTVPTANLQVVQSTTGAGTVSVGAGGTAWTGVGTQFLNTFKVGDTITSEGQTLTIATITTNTALTTNAVGAAISAKAYTLAGGTRFSVLGNGNVGIGNTAPGYLLHVGSASVTDATVLLRLQDADSTCDFTANSGSPSCGSDLTLKKNIFDQTDNLTKVLSLRPVTYNWLTDGDDITTVQHGFIAQEVADVMPELVTDGTWIDGSTKKFLQTAGMTPYIVGAIKEMDLKLESLAMPIDEVTNKTFAERFFDKLIAWLGSSDNGIEKICVKKSDGTSFCANGDQLEKAVNGLSGGSVAPKKDPVVAPVDPTCTATQTLVNHICTDPAPADPTCTATQTLVNHICTDPAPEGPTQAEIDAQKLKDEQAAIDAQKLADEQAAEAAQAEAEAKAAAEAAAKAALEAQNPPETGA